MHTILVNKSNDPVQLKILFPHIKIALDGTPAYGKVIYRNFEYPLSEKTELLLEQSTSGFQLDSHLGLLGFLRECGYMSSTKIERFETAGRDKITDSAGRIVSPEGVFHKNPDVLNMYFYCSTLKISNRVFIDDEIDVEYLLDILEAPFYNRLIEADGYGHEKLLTRLLQFLDSFYSNDLQFKARRNSKGVSGFDRMSMLMSYFDMQAFNSYELSGDFTEDLFVFLSYFK